MLSRRSRLRTRTPLRRTSGLRQHRPTERRVPDGYSDPAYLAWLRTQVCRVPGCRGLGDPHHLRHDENGASLGGQLKDDRRAISLCRLHHTALHAAPWVVLAEIPMKFSSIKEWQDLELSAQRAAYLGRKVAL